MKKHPFLQVDFQSSVKLTAADERKLKTWLDFASQTTEKLSKEGILAGQPQSIQVSLLICGDSRIRVLNREHRQKDKVTDVLSFPNYENLRKTMPEKNLFLGDLAICFPQAKRQAKEFDIGLWDEFIHLFFHGMLHLMGYDHEISAKEEKLMQEWEDKALKQFSKIKAKKKGA